MVRRLKAMVGVWSTNHPLLTMMCVSLAGKEFLGAIDTLGHMRDLVYVADVIKKYLIEVGP
jgi:hypothetical protein